jgi:hypothetical protein
MIGNLLLVLPVISVAKKHWQIPKKVQLYQLIKMITYCLFLEWVWSLEYVGQKCVFNNKKKN